MAFLPSSLVIVTVNARAVRRFALAMDKLDAAAESLDWHAELQEARRLLRRSYREMRFQAAAKQPIKRTRRKKPRKGDGS